MKRTKYRLRNKLLIESLIVMISVKSEAFHIAKQFAITELTLSNTRNFQLFRSHKMAHDDMGARGQPERFHLKC